MYAWWMATRTDTEVVPFPFLGQGDARSFEWFEMWVWFERDVPRAKRADLTKGAPPPCLRDLQWPHADLMWPSTGDQWIHKHLKSAYRKTKNPQKAFNDAIEKWLLEMHAKEPILFAVRRQDHEASGTRLGAWHAASVGAFKANVQKKLPRKVPKKDLRASAIELALEYIAPPREAAIVDEEDALRDLDGAFREKKFADVRKHSKRITSSNGRLHALVKLADNAYCMGVDISSAPAHNAILSMVDALEQRKLSVVRSLPFAKKELSIHLVCVAYAGALQAAAWANDRAVFDRVAKLLDEVPDALRSYLIDTADTLEAKRPEFARRIRALMPSPTAMELWILASRTGDLEKRLEIYEQAASLPKTIWEVVNHGIATALAAHPQKLPQDVAQRWLDRGLAYERGEVHRNVARLLVRMGRNDDAVKHVVLASKRGADRDKIRTDKIFTPIRKHPDFAAALKVK